MVWMQRIITGFLEEVHDLCKYVSKHTLLLPAKTLTSARHRGVRAYRKLGWNLQEELVRHLLPGLRCDSHKFNSAGELQPPAPALQRIQERPRVLRPVR